MTTKKNTENHETLGDNTIPSRYTLFFEPDFETFKSKGKEIIECNAQQETKSIKLNSKEIEIISASVKSKENVQTAKIKHNKKAEQIELVLEMPARGQIEIVIEFICTNNDGMYGFYRSQYSVNGKQKYILTSQFEAANARAAFPCFDEPEFKATFCVSMQIDKNLSSISNMPIKSEKEVSNNKKIVEFLETPRMSSYLLYLSAGEFEFTEDYAGDLPIRIVTVPGKKELTALPMEFAKKSLLWLQDYFGIKYPLPKLDFIAIPDFAAGAMENWGAITFREIALLGNEKTAISNKQYIAIVIAHEIVHQWFGDLVTMKWWDDLWLNESFAEFMSHKAINELYPEWKIGVQYIEHTIGTAFSADSLKSTHPINVNVKSVGEIASIFDAISYQKGGSILYMLEDYLGKEIYQKGLNRYLAKHAYSNATKHDLWDAFQETSQKYGSKIVVSDIIEKWILKPGHPMIHVKKVPGGFSLNQKRYMLLEEADDSWPIPIHYLGSNGPSDMLLEKKDYVLKDSGKWIKLNYGQKGFYRVKYEDELIGEIGNLINENEISDLDAWGIANDLFSFVRSGRITVPEYLGFVMKYCMSKGYPTNSSISSHLSWLYNISYGHAIGEEVRKATLEFHRKILDKIGWERKETDNIINITLRSDAIANLGFCDDEDILKRAKKEFTMHIKKEKDMDANIRGVIYSLNAWQGNSETFDYFLKKYKEEKSPDEQRRNLRALGSFRDLNLLKKTLELSVSDEIRLQDSFVLPITISGNPVGKGLVWPWARKNWKTLLKRYDTGTHMLGRLVENFSFVSDEKTLSDMKGFFENKGNRRDDIEMALSHAIEKNETNIRFIKVNYK